MDWRERIVVDPAVLVGKPFIKGTRISVELVMERLADGWSMDDILRSYPGLAREDVLAAISFVTEIYKEEDHVAIGKAHA